eukprot:symbB.v1.2.024574.t1/scaffold2317.1/size82517/1
MSLDNVFHVAANVGTPKASAAETSFFGAGKSEITVSYLHFSCCVSIQLRRAGGECSGACGWHRSLEYPFQPDAVWT